MRRNLDTDLWLQNISTRFRRRIKTQNCISTCIKANRNSIFFLLFNITYCNVTTWTKILTKTSLFAKKNIICLYNQRSKWNEFHIRWTTNGIQKIKNRVSFTKRQTIARCLKNMNMSLQFMDNNLNRLHFKVEFFHAGIACVHFLSLPNQIHIKPMCTKLVSHMFWNFPTKQLIVLNYKCYKISFLSQRRRAFLFYLAYTYIWFPYLVSFIEFIDNRFCSIPSHLDGKCALI